MKRILFALQLAAAGASWESIGPFGGGAEAIVVDPSNPTVLTAATRNGLLYQSNDSGAHWNALAFRSPSAIHTLVIAPLSRPILYIGASGDGIFRSNDAGKTWNPAADLRGATVFCVSVWKKDPQVVAAGTDRGVYLTRDSGDHWQRISPAGNAEMQTITALAIDPDNAEIIYAGTAHLPWRTMTGGRNWQPIHTGMIDDSDVFSIEIDGRDPKHIYASACSGIYSSRNRGDTWSKVLGIPRTSRRTYVIRQDPSNPETVYAGTSHSLWKTSRLDWREISGHIVKSIAFDSRRTYFATEDNGLMVAAEGAKDLGPINHGFVNLSLTPLETDGERIYSTTLYQNPENSIFRTDARGGGWTRIAHAANLLYIAPLTSKVLFAGTYDAVLKSSDAGQSWARVWKGDSVRGLKVLKTTPPQLLLGTSTGLFRSADLGVHWLPVNGVEGIGAISSSSDSNFAVVEAGGKLLGSEDGVKWTEIPMPCPPEELYQVAAGPDHILLAGTAHGAYRREGDGAWERVANGATVRVVYFAPTTGEAFAVRSGMVLRSKDTGRTWTPLEMSGVDGKEIRSLIVAGSAPDRLFAQTRLEGVFVSALPGAVTTGSYPSIRSPHGLHGQSYVVSTFALFSFPRH